MVAPSEIGPVHVAGRYALYEQIGAGGVATVYVGRLRGAIGFARTVAIKRLHPQYVRDTEFVTMFVDEARLASRIRHTNDLQTIEFVAEEGELFLVMEYIQGETLAGLRRRLRGRGERMPVNIAASLIVGTLQGLHAAHETRDENGENLDIVHRDISPQNIIVGVDGLARVLDFGIARAGGRVHTSQVGKIKGKIGYMPPEQLEGEHVTRVADVYSASVVLWELLTGKRLFRGESNSAVLARVLKGDVTPPSEVEPEVPAAYDAVVMKGIARDPRDRFASAQEMAAALEECGHTESHSRVAAWLEDVAGDLLAARADQVARFERSEFSEISELRAMVDELASSQTSTSAVVDSQPAEKPARPEKAPRSVWRVRALKVSLGVTLAALGLGAAWLMSPTGKPAGTAAGEPARAAPKPSPPIRPKQHATPAPSAAAPQAPASADNEPNVESPVEVASAPAPASTPAKSSSPEHKPRVRRSSKKKASSEPASPFDGLGGRL